MYSWQLGIIQSYLITCQNLEFLEGLKYTDNLGFPFYLLYGPVLFRPANTSQFFDIGFVALNNTLSISNSAQNAETMVLLLLKNHFLNIKKLRL